MQILKYKLEAYVPFDNDSIEKFLFLCEETINNLTSDKEIIFKLKSATHELLINSLEHGYGKTSEGFFLNGKNRQLNYSGNDR